ncbi:MAG TPA: NUDIX hydrolase [Steroidobacter sp.]
MPLSIRSVFTGRVIQVNVERVELPNRSIADLEIIHHPGGAAVAAIDERKRLCLLRQFRHAAGGWVWELPAGKIDNREPPLETAKRELLEEAGRTAAHWVSLGESLSSPGVLTEVVHLFLATELSDAQEEPEEHEVFEVHWKPFEEALAMARSGELRDAKSVIAVFRAAFHIGAL